MLRGLFVTGTDTGVGKTAVSAALMVRYRDVPTLRYWKPIQTGVESDDDTRTVATLSACGPAHLLEEGIRLPRPLSPHLSARLAARPISVIALLELAASQPGGDRWIVEGAGGVLVPLDDRTLVADLIVQLGLPAIVVARSGLGTINHTLLTIEALRARAIVIAGVVMVGDLNEENRLAIERHGHVSVCGELPVLAPLSAEALAHAAHAIDTSNTLRSYFQ